MPQDSALMEPELPSIEITDGQCRLALDVLRRENPQAQGFWDANWMVAGVQATAPGFHVHFKESLHLSELVALREQVREMYSTLRGGAELDATEGWMNLKAGMDKLGHVRWSVEITYPVALSGARLQFEINNDQTYLPGLLNQLNAVLELFPIIGGT